MPHDDAKTMPKQCQNNAKTMPKRCKNNAKKMQFLCPKDTHTKNPKIARALSISPNPDASRGRCYKVSPGDGNSVVYEGHVAAYLLTGASSSSSLPASLHICLLGPCSLLLVFAGSLFGTNWHSKEIISVGKAIVTRKVMLVTRKWRECIIVFRVPLS